MNSNKHKPVICFRRWSRKGYAVFASLDKVVKIGVVTFGCTLVQQEYQPVLAQSDSTRITREVDLEEVEISESPIRLGSGLASAISVTDQKEIAASPARSIDDILEQIAGLDVRQRASDGVQADLSIRGGSFDQVMILLNGANITDPQTGHYSLDIPVDLQQIRRIETLQGSGTRIWGPNAFSGAINIITTPDASAPAKQGSLEIGTGSFGYRKEAASGFLQNRSWQLGGSFSHKKSDGYTDNTDFNLFDCHIQVGFKSQSTGTFLFQSAYQQKAFGANSFYSFSYPNQFERTKTLFGSLNWEKNIGKTNLQAQIYERQHHDRFELFRNMENAAPSYTGHNFHQTDVAGGNLKALKLSHFGKTTVGMDIRNEHIFSNVLGLALAKTKTDYLDKNGIFTKEKNRTNYRIFIDQTVYLGSCNISAGVSGNKNSDFGNDFFGGMDATYDVTSSFKAYFNINKAVRFPTFTDLYYNSTTQISNPNLKSEISTTYESGLKFHKRNVKALLSIYYREGKNVIDWVKMPDSIKWESKNLTGVNAIGGEMTTEYHFQRSFMENIRLSYAYLHLDKEAKGYDSKYALDYLKHKISLHLEHRVFESRKTGKLNGVWNMSWQDRAGNYTDFLSQSVIDYQPCFITDVRLQWNKKGFGIYTDINNLFNARYADFGGLMLPGRSFHAGLRLTL
ncbi:MAG: TonB-dependent receptor [Bacteroidales bacterium]|nr:TonB-dependent receptor [Bacteroidales bacterium]